MATNKFWKKKKQGLLKIIELSILEQQIGQALTQVEGTIPEVKNLRLSSVIDFTAKINPNKQVYLIFIPYPCLQFIKRQVQSYWLNQRKELRQRFWQLLNELQEANGLFSKTLTTAYDGLFEDLIQPSAILGRRTRVRTDDTKFYRIQEKDILIQYIP